MTFQFDESRTARRVEDLERYYSDNVLRGNSFVCPSFAACSQSINDHIDFYEGQLSHVGSRYDLFKDHRPLRIVVSGLDYGHPPRKVNMSDRRTMIVDYAGVKHPFYAAGSKKKQRTSQGRGTSLILKRILLGSESLAGRGFANQDTEFLESPQDPQSHMFNMYAQVNFLLCSAVADQRQSRSSKLMRSSCAEHYWETLKILQPTILVVQGKGRFRGVVDELGIRTNWERETETWGRFRGDGLEFVTCDFTHPSARSKGWVTPNQQYFQSHVAPTMDTVLRHLELDSETT